MQRGCHGNFESHSEIKLFPTGGLFLRSRTEQTAEIELTDSITGRNHSRIMQRLKFCACGGTAWKSREDGGYTIHCDKCECIVSHEILSECRFDWDREQAKIRRRIKEEGMDSQ
jgi:hypothetical protein